jgi:hypothetical protein
VLCLLSACQANPSKPEPANVQEAAKGPEIAKTEPTPPQAKTDIEPAPPQAKTEPKPPKPEPAPPPPAEHFESETGTDPLLAALSKGAPEAVELLAVHEHGRERIALYRLDVVAQWQSEHDDVDELLEPLEAIAEECSSSYGEVDGKCVADNAPSKLPGVPPEIARYAATETYAWELGHVKLDGDNKASVLARKRLFEFGRPCTGDCFETKLKVYDMDGDARSEVFAVFPVEVDSDHGTLGAASSALAFVLDKADLHVQFATTRMHRDEGGDLSSHLLEVETSFVARDTNGDSHPDLVVREKGVETRSGGEEEDTGDESRRIDASTTCLFERAGDRWVCSQTLGKQVIDGGALIEVTRVPLPELAPPTDTGPAPEVPPG